MTQHDQDSIGQAIHAIRQGYQPLAIMDGGKRPFGSSWTQTRWAKDTGEEEIRGFFKSAADKGASGLGVLLGEPSGGLIDIDLDHPLALRLRDYFLPPSDMETGRAGRPRSHRWYIVEGDLPSTRRYKMPDGKAVSVELRSTGAQTVIPPSIHPTGEAYRWEGQPWGGEAGPAVVDGRKLAIQVALLGLACVLLEKWPRKGSRHEAYLNLAGGLLRYGDGVHEYWERNLPVLISAIADATHDDDGADTRVAEVMGTTLTRLREGKKVAGFPSLGEIIGADHAELVRRMAKEVESLSGFTPEVVRHVDERGKSMAPPTDEPQSFHDDAVISTLPPEERNPLEERISSWAAVDIEPYLTGQVTMPEPSVLRREDGKGLFYPGRVNSLYGKSESAKSWLSLYACVQEMALGERVMYLDLEDEPAGTLARVQALGAGFDDLKNQFRYVHPEGPLAAMQKYRFGHAATDEGRVSESVFHALLDSFDPTLIVVDGMTVLYGLHGHDTNEATATDVITSWLKSMCRGGRTTVLVIDHTGKGGGPGSSPIGAHHKVAMVQGTAIRADAITRPMPGSVGHINLVVYKDRPGAVRQISSTTGDEQIAAEVEMDSTEEGVTKMTLRPPNPNHVVLGATDGQSQKLAELAEAREHAERVLDCFDGDLERRLKTPQVMRQTGLERHQVYSVWELLTTEGTIIREGATSATRYRLAEPRADEAETASDTLDDPEVDRDDSRRSAGRSERWDESPQGGAERPQGWGSF